MLRRSMSPIERAGALIYHRQSRNYGANISAGVSRLYLRSQSHAMPCMLASPSCIPSVAAAEQQQQQLGLLPYALVVHRYYASDTKSKVEETLRMLKEDLESKRAAEEKRKAMLPAADKPKPSLMTRVKNELMHYYHGFRLLALETRLSFKYLWQMARGRALTRRERQQLVRTVSDLFRIVPFSVFIIVPFMEFTLPIFIKLFPNMLPSTFQEASKEEERIRRSMKMRIEMAKFLQDTLEEISLEKRKKKTKAKTALDKAEEEEAESKAYEFAQFLRRIRTEGGYVSNADLFKYTKLFEDELTLDNLAMSQLRAICRMLNVVPLGTPEILRFQLMMKLRDLKADDRMIAAEGGVDALDAQELQVACRARGMRAIGVSEQRLRDQLKQWLELSLSDKVPPSLLLLSRALYLPEEINFTDRLKTIFTALPEELGEQARQRLTELEGGKVDYKERLALVKHIEDELNKERVAAAEQEKRAVQEKEAKETKEREAAAAAEPAAPPVPAATTTPDRESAIIANLLAGDKEAERLRKEAVADLQPLDIDKPKAGDFTQEKLDVDTLHTLEDILHGSSIEEAKHDITDLKEKVSEHTEDLLEVGSLAGEELAETKIAQRLRKRVNHLISGVDSLMAKLETERYHIKEEGGEEGGKGEDTRLPVTPELQIEGKKSERLVRIEDLLVSLKKLKKVEDDVKNKRIEEALKAIDADTDGAVDANLVLEVLELLGRHKDVEISTKEMKSIVEMLRKEDALESLTSGAAASASEMPGLPPPSEPTSNKSQKGAQPSATSSKGMEKAQPTSMKFTNSSPSQRPPSPSA